MYIFLNFRLKIDPEEKAERNGRESFEANFDSFSIGFICLNFAKLNKRIRSDKKAQGLKGFNRVTNRCEQKWRENGGF